MKKTSAKPNTPAAPIARLASNPLALALSSALACMNAGAAPVVGNGGGAGGSASISRDGNVTNINQPSRNAIINWQSFSTAPSETVNFIQPGVSAVVLNRVIGNEQSVLQGALNANGKVFLVNPNGVLFTRGSSVNAAGLVVSTLNITDRDFNAGKYVFQGGSGGAVINMGTITVADGGYVALLGNSVSNRGVISANRGTVSMNGGSKVTLDFNGDSMASVTIDEGALNALVENREAIYADGGRVILTARAADDLLSAQVNHSGVIQARTVGELKGNIELRAIGGTADIAGLIDASAPHGGDGGAIETSGERVRIADGAAITTAAPRGKTGQWLIDPNDFTIGASADMSASALAAMLVNTNATISTAVSGMPGNGDIFVNEAVTWSSANTLTLLAERDININAAVTGRSGTLALTAARNINPGAAVDVGTFILNNGAWKQQGALPAFSARDFRIAGGSFLRTAGGDGSGAAPYQLADIYGLQGMASAGFAASSFLLANDIDAAGTAAWNGGAGFTPIGSAAARYTGTFDGGLHTLSNLTIRRPDDSIIGLFGYVGAGGVLKNLTMRNVDISGYGNVGALAGVVLGGAVDKVAAAGTVSGTSTVGGLVGTLSQSSLSNASADMTLRGVSTVGGLVGSASRSTVSNVATAGTITNAPSIYSSSNFGGVAGSNSQSSIADAQSRVAITVTNSSYIGGLVGYNSGSAATTASILRSTAYGNILVTYTARPGTDARVGGLVGWSNYGSITDSAAHGNVRVEAGDFSAAYIGGLVGYNQSGAISGSRATGNVTANGATTNVGGLVGFNYGSIDRSSATGSVTGGFYVGGLVGSNAGVSGLSGYGAITNSSASGNVAWNGYGAAPAYGTAIGGLAGQSGSFASIGNSSATGNVSGKATVGGLVGSNGGHIDGSQASGNVTASGVSNSSGYAEAGGLVGSNFTGFQVGSWTASISNSSASGNVTGSAAGTGGLVGVNGYAVPPGIMVTGGAISNSTASGSVIGNNNADKLVGLGDSGRVSNSSWHDAPAEAAAKAAAEAAAREKAQAEQQARTELKARADTATDASRSLLANAGKPAFQAQPPVAHNTAPVDLDGNISRAASAYSANVNQIEVDGVSYELGGGAKAPE